MQPYRLAIATFAACAAFVSLPACSHNHHSGGSSNLVGNADILIHDAAADDLLFFSGDIQSVRLRRQSGALTADLLTGGAVDVEFLGLDGASALLVHASIPADAYTSVQIGFTPGSYSARTRTGADVTVTATNDVFDAPLTALLTISDGDYVRLDVDVDLFSSLSGDVATGAVTFTPDGTATFDSGVTSVSVRELKARVTAVDSVNGTVTADTFADDDQAMPLGSMTIHTGTTLLFLDQNGTPLSTSQFESALVANQTLLDVQGTLGTDGQIDATRLMIEDQTGGAGSTDLVRIQGVVVGLDANSFRLLLSHVQDGSVVADPIVAVLPDSTIVDVSFDALTVFLRGSTQLDDSGALAIGSVAQVTFCSFAVSPFPACMVDVSSARPQLAGTVTNIAGVPGNFVMHLDAGDPAITAGLVQDPTTDIPVDLTSSTIVFDGPGDPALLPDDLALGMELETQGTLAGTATAPTLAATQVRVSGGFFDGASMATVDELNSSFTTSGGTLVDTFGPTVTTGTQQVLIQPGATFSGAALSSSEFFALLNGSQGAAATINVRGLPTANPNEIRAFDVHTTLPSAF